MVVAGLAGTAGYFYLLGGVVTWLRLRALDLPADDALAIVPREQLLATGLGSVVVPVAAVAVALGLVVRTGLRAIDVSTLFAAFALGWAVWEAEVGDDVKVGYIVFVGLLAASAFLVVRWARPRGPTAAPRGKRGAVERWAYIGFVLLVGLLVPAVVLNNRAVSVAVLATVALSWVGGRWIEDASTDSLRLGRGLMAAAVIALAFRLITEAQPPSPLAPTIAFTTKTSVCPGEESQAVCATTGYLVASTGNAIYLAASSEREPDLVRLRERRDVTGTIIELPRSTVVDVRHLEEVEVVREKEEEAAIEKVVD